MKSLLLATMLTAILATLLVQVFFLWGLTEYFGVFTWQQDAPISTPSEFTGPIDEDPQAMWEGCVAANNNNAAEVCGPPPE